MTSKQKQPPEKEGRLGGGVKWEEKKGQQANFSDKMFEYSLISFAIFNSV